MQTESFRQAASMSFRRQKTEKGTGASKEGGRKSRRFSTRENYFRQDIKFHEYVIAVLKYAGFLAVIAYLYYESVWAFLLFLPGVFFYLRQWEAECIEKKKKEFALQFQEAIRSLGASLHVGYSLENAIKETKKDISILYNEQTAIRRELDYMIRQIYLQIPMEQILGEWAERVDQEDLRSFVNVFVTAKKSGGDSLAVIRDSITQIRDKMEMQREIDTILAARKYEFKVMAVIPFGIIAYMKISFPEFMDVLYGNVIGAGVMSVCLGVYLAAYYLGEKIVNIEI